MAAVLVGLAALAVAVDLPVSEFLREGTTPHRVPSDLRKLITLAEVFGHGTGVACILLTVYVLDRSGRRRLPRVVVGVVGSGLAADLVKLFAARARPRALEVQAIWDSFLGWFPIFTGVTGSSGRASDIQSFPSGHTAVAVGLAVGLSWLYPQCRWQFAFFAVLVAAQRLHSGAHYLSDTLAGAAVACFICGMCFDRRLLGRWFERIESVLTT
jgi:membrane-associated phospholipid phosphatase